MPRTIWDDCWRNNHDSDGRVSVFQIIIFLMYVIAGVLLALTRLDIGITMGLGRVQMFQLLTQLNTTIMELVWLI